MKEYRRILSGLEDAVRSGSSQQENITLLKELDMAAQFIRRPGTHGSGYLSEDQVRLALEHKAYHVFKVASIHGIYGALIVKELWRIIEDEDVDAFKCFSGTISGLDESHVDDIVHSLRLSKNSNILKFLLIMVQSRPKLSLAAFADVIRQALNQDSPVSFEILKRSAMSSQLTLELYAQIRNPKTKSSMLCALRDSAESSLSKETCSLLFELVKKETVEANGEIMVHILAEKASSFVQSLEFVRFIADGFKAAKPKPFLVKAICFASSLSDKFMVDLKNLFAKELKNPSSNDLLMSLTAILKDRSAATVAQRSGFFLNDQYVLADGKCGISLECQLIAIHALVAVIGVNPKAIDRLLEIVFNGDFRASDKAIEVIARLPLSLVREFFKKLGSFTDGSREPRLRRLILAISKEKSLHSELFFLLTRPVFHNVSSVKRLERMFVQPIDYSRAMEMTIDQIKFCIPYLSLPEIEKGFAEWLQNNLPVLTADHVKVWKASESDTPVLDIEQSPKLSRKLIVVRNSKESRSDQAIVKQQLEEEREMRSTVLGVVDRFEKVALIFQLFADNNQSATTIDDLLENILELGSGVYGEFVGQQLSDLVKLVGGGRLVLSEGVRFADWILSMSPRYSVLARYRSFYSPQVTPGITTINPSMADHPRAFVIFSERYVEIEDSGEGVGGLLLFIQRNSASLRQFAGRVLHVICKAANRFETLEEECELAVQELADKDAVSVDLALLNELLVSESSTSRRLSLSFVKFCYSGYPDELRPILFCLGLDCSPPSLPILIDFLLEYKHLSAEISTAICSTINHDGLSLLKAKYRELLSVRTPEGPKERVMNIDLTVEQRTLIGRVLTRLPAENRMDAHGFPPYFLFVLEETLCDPSPVSSEPAVAFFESCRHILMQCPGLDSVLLPVLEHQLGHPPKTLNELSVDRQDMYRTWLIVLMAILSRCLPAADPRRDKVLTVLEKSLTTPSESVQMAVADGMVPLVGHDYPDARNLYSRLTDQLTTAKTMAERRGAAFGLGALFKANGLGFVFRQDFLGSVLLPALVSGSTGRQGALFGIELMARSLSAGLFEPLLPPLLPSLLSCFTGAKQEIREAAMDATAAIISSGLSVHVVKMILPILFEPLDSSASQWRSRVAALEWLGVMAGIRGRRALAVYLPVIVPRLTAGLADAHVQVQRAARETLLQYGRVLRNPEIQRLFPLLLAALSDPPANTARCLDKIIETSFTHVVDGPSLALLEPMLMRALTDRMSSSTGIGQSASNMTASVEVKKRAAQIIGNLGSIIDPLELIPCLPGLTRALMAALGDPVPEVRSVAARVLGVLSQIVDPRRTRVMSKVEEDCIRAVVDPDPTTILGRIDRAGRAQAVAEIFAHSHGPTETATLLASQLRPQSSNDYVRMEGFIRLIGYLPTAFAAKGQAEQLYEEAGLGEFLNQLLLELAVTDPEPASLVEGWREACERTLRLFIARYCLHDPVGIFGSLVQSIGSLQIPPRGRLLAWKLLLEEYLGRVFPPADREIHPDDEVTGSAAVMASESPTGQELMTLLPGPAVKRLQAAAFLSRYDTHSAVRTVASGVWKALGEHPVRVVLESIPSIVDLFSHADDAAGQYSRAIEELLERMADRVCIPLLECIRDGLIGNTRVGLIRLSTIIFSTLSKVQLTKNQLDATISICVDILDTGLSFKSADQSIQAECGEALFPVMAEAMGVEPLLQRLQSGLNGLVHIRPDLVLPVLLPGLESNSDHEAVLDTIEAISMGASEALSGWFIDLLRLTVKLPATGRQLKLAERLITNCIVEREQAMLLADYLEGMEDDEDGRSRLVGAFYTRKDRSFDYILYPLIRPEHYEGVIQRVVSPSSLLPYIKCVDDTLTLLFISKLILPILSNSNERSQGLDAMREFPLHTLSPTSIASLVGVLIRILSDKHTIDDTIRTHSILLIKRLLSSCPAPLKPFHPQLQRVLVGGLPEGAARDCLAILKGQLARPQSLLSELEGMVESGGETEARKSAAKFILSARQ